MLLIGDPCLLARVADRSQILERAHGEHERADRAKATKRAERFNTRRPPQQTVDRHLRRERARKLGEVVSLGELERKPADDLAARHRLTRRERSVTVARDRLDRRQRRHRASIAAAGAGAGAAGRAQRRK